jgi:hypothetical protein
MNGRAWVVEINYVGDEWLPEDAYVTRYDARRQARYMRADGWRVRVRQYFRHPGNRP